jgi:oligopeptide transport system permease protein
MLLIFLKRIFIAIPVLFIVSSLTFIFIRLAPGGPFLADKAMDPVIMANIRKAYNLDAPLFQQYLDYMTGVLKGDFGPSFKYSTQSVTDLISQGFPITFELAFYAILIAMFIGIFSGVLAALKRNTLLDFIPMSIAMIGICVPTFLMGPLLVLLFGNNISIIGLNIFPAAGWGEGPYDKVLPSVTLGFAYAAYIARLSRGGMLEVLGQDFIRTARAKGLSEFTVVTKHAMQGGLLPVVSFLGPAIAGLIAGSFVVETIFNIPGLGRYYVEAAFNRDYTMILGTTIFFSSLIVFFNLLSDLAALSLNPRARDNS